MDFLPSENWKSAYPGALAGILAMQNAANPEASDALDARKAEVEAGARARFAGTSRAGLSALPAIRPYVDYYGRFKKTYHVLLQLESVALKGKSLPRAAALVEAMFMAEMKDMLLTAGHDLDTLQLPLTLDISNGTETYTLMRGDEQLLKPDDMFIRDGLGVISSIIYGPDRRTQISADTRNVVYTVYAPAGVGEQAALNHLQNIRDYVLLIAPAAQVELLKVFGSYEN
jgi:DNA/RNA-binding domain of Phe-tRNA-synthetase-like protein